MGMKARVTSSFASKATGNNNRPIDRFVAALKGCQCDPKSKSNGQWEAKCPAHEDNDPSLGFTQGDDGRVLVTCRAGCSFREVMKSLGLEESDAFAPNDEGPRKAKSKPQEERRDKAGMAYKSPEKAIAACARGRGQVSAKWGPWIYNDAEGFEVMRIYRIEKPNGKKEFRPIYPDAAGWRIGDPYESGLPLYGLDKLGTAGTVYVTEGEKCADLVKDLGFVATTSSHGSGSPKKTDWSPLAGRNVVLLPDHDQAGEKYADDVGALLMELDPKPSVKVLRLPLSNDGDDFEQWLESLSDGWTEDQTKAELATLAEAAPEWVPVPRKKLTICADDVQEEPVEYLWQERIARAFVSLFAGQTGLGKTFVALDVIARLTTGKPLPGTDEVHDPIRVLIISEDSQSRVLRPRLEALGADLKRVEFMTWEAMEEYTLDNVEYLVKAYEDAGKPDLIVIDPPTNFTGSYNEHSNVEVRKMLRPITAWLMKMGTVACVLITHINKNVTQGLEALERIMGSVAWTTTPRIIVGFVKDPKDPNRCICGGLKNNLGDTASSLSYSLSKSRAPDRVEWNGTSETGIADAMTGKSVSKSVVAWLEDMFREKREWESNDIKSMGTLAGFSGTALFKSDEVKALPIRKTQRYDSSREPANYWVWTAMDGWPPPKTT